MARAYSRKAPVEMPSLSEYERQQKAIDWKSGTVFLAIASGNAACQHQGHHATLAN